MSDILRRSLAPICLPVSRRHFIQTALAASAGYLLAGGGAAAQGSHARSGHWAFIADTHVPQDPKNEYRGFFPYDNFKQVAAAVQAVNPEGAVIVGDVARLEGLVGDYANVRDLSESLRTGVPLHFCLGNHDDRKNFLDAFANLPGDRQPVEGKYVNIVETNGVRFLFLDSLLYVNRAAGLLGRNQRTWIEEYLAQSDNTPLVLFFHHTLGDGDGDLLDVERLFRVITPERKVKAVVYGHSHEYRYDTQDGIHLINLPASGYNFNDGEPIGWVEANVAAEGIDLTLRAIGGNRANDGKTTSLEWRT